MEGWKKGDLALGVIVLAATGAVAVWVSVAGVPQSSCARVQGITRTFNVVADNNGYNGTRSQGGLGPFMTAQTCDTVVVFFKNKDVQAHGLSIDSYAPNGLETLGGDIARLQFLASKPGDFRVFCKTLCSVHGAMQNARLTIGCSPGPGCP